MLFSHRPAHLEPVELRHHDVEHQQGGWTRANLLERFFSVSGLDDLEARLNQRVPDHLAQVRIVVGHKNRLRHRPALWPRWLDSCTAFVAFE